MFWPEHFQYLRHRLQVAMEPVHAEHLDDLTDSLCLVSGDDQDRVAAFDDDQVRHTNSSYERGVVGHNDVPRTINNYAAPGDDVAVLVRLANLSDRGPRSDVVPPV